METADCIKRHPFESDSIAGLVCDAFEQDRLYPYLREQIFECLAAHRELAFMRSRKKSAWGQSLGGDVRLDFKIEGLTDEFRRDYSPSDAFVNEVAAQRFRSEFAEFLGLLVDSCVYGYGEPNGLLNLREGLVGTVDFRCSGGFDIWAVRRCDNRYSFDFAASIGHRDTIVIDGKRIVGPRLIADFTVKIKADPPFAERKWEDGISIDLPGTDDSVENPAIAYHLKNLPAGDMENLAPSIVAALPDEYCMLFVPSSLDTRLKFHLPDHWHIEPSRALQARFANNRKPS